MIQEYIIRDRFIKKDNIWFASDVEAVSYPEEYQDILFKVEDKSFWFQHRNRYIIEAVKLFPPCDTIFDVGAGNGFVSKGLVDVGFDVALVEPEITGALNARRRGSYDILNVQFNEHFFRKDSIQAVALFDVIEHIKDDKTFLHDINLLMKKDGYLYLTTPAYQGLWSEADINDGHFRRYSINQLKSILRNNGFEILFDSYFFWYLPLPIYLFRTLPHKFGCMRKNPSESLKNELTPRWGGCGKVLGNCEINRLKGHKRMPFGASVLIIAQKIRQK